MVLMSRSFSRDFPLEVSRGKISSYAALTIDGKALDCDNGVATDVWDGADGATSTDIWVAPTTARVHDVKSTSANDTSAGTGARTVRVFGLEGWGTPEVSEDVTLNGTSNVATSNSYVVINRLECLTFGSGGTNAGIITATAQTDATVSAAIQAGVGESKQAIYGLPSTKSLYLVQLFAELGVSLTANVTGKLLVKENADLGTAGFINKGEFTFNRAYQRDYLRKKIAGPAIVKIQVSASADNSIVYAGFEAYLA